jgi:hypothetical protein
MSLEQLLLQEINNKGELSVDYLDNFTKQAGYKTCTGQRKSRLLHQEGKIERVMKGNILVAYKPIKKVNNADYWSMTKKELDDELRKLMNTNDPIRLNDILGALRNNFEVSKVTVIKRYS